jgi:hypothetical protein
MRQFYLIFATDYGPETGDIDLTLSDDEQTMTGTIGLPRLGYGSRPVKYTKVRELEPGDTSGRPSLPPGRPTPLPVGRWSDGDPNSYVEIKLTNGRDMSLTRYGTDNSFRYQVLVSMEDKTLKFAIPSSGGPRDAELTLSKDGVIMEGTLTDRTSGRQIKYRLDRVIMVGR